MITLKSPSDKPCFICGSKEDAAIVKFADGSFSGTLCKKHVYEKLGKEKKSAEAPASGPKTQLQSQ